METLPTKIPVNQCVIPARGAKKKPNVIVFKSYVLSTKTAVRLLLNGKLKRKVCRYCLRITGPLSELDQIMQIASKTAMYKVTIRDIVASVHPFKVTEDPNLPSKICEKCLNKAIRSYLFAQQCEQSERALRNCFEDMYEKLDKLDPLERTKKRGRQKLNPNYNVLYTEHRNVIDYADPIRNLINVSAVPLTKEPMMGDLECKKCWQILPNVESLANHEKMHPKSMWYNCRICGKAFAKKFHMKRHLRIHAKGKVPDLVHDENFVCKQCGHATENHDLHLQHIEKHKFQTVLEHLVERKMDKLCSVCFNSDSKMIEMNKMICLHGGYPELTGDRTLYSILGSTVPEPKYKYQELIIPHKSIILKFTKKNKLEKYKNTDNSSFTFSLPKIVTLAKINHTQDVFIFCAPETSNTVNDLDQELANNELYETEISPDEKTEISPDEILEENNANNKQIGNIMYMEYQFTFSKPDMIETESNPELADIEINESANSREKEILSAKRDISGTPVYDTCSEIKNVDDMQKDTSNDLVKVLDKAPVTLSSSCKYCWIFKSTNKCEYCQMSTTEINKNIHCNNDNPLHEAMHIPNTPSIPCKYCWIFKHTAKCEYCKMSTTKNNKDNGSEKNTQLYETLQSSVDKISHDIYNEIKDTEIKYKATKRKLDPENVKASKKAKWQCKICLTTNITERDTCLCCQSEKVYKEKMKLNFSDDFTIFMKDIVLKRNDKPDVNKNVFESINTMSVQNTTESDKSSARNEVVSVCAVNLAVNEGRTIENMESSDSPLEVSQIELTIPNENSFEETMDIATEEESLPSNISSVQVIASAIAPTKILSNSGITQDAHLFQPIASSLGFFSVVGHSATKSYFSGPRNDLQFNIGTSTKEDKLNYIKNFRKTLRKLNPNCK